MSMGYHYDRGKKIGYDITIPGSVTLWAVSSKDKSRIIKEIMQAHNCKKEDIEIERVKI